MKKHFIAGMITGGVVLGTMGVFAGQYMATENPFPIQLNGTTISLTGYNINDETYFKLRDIADAVGTFSVDFNNNTIQLSKDGYTYQSTQTATNPTERPSKVAKPTGTAQPFIPNTLTEEDLKYVNYLPNLDDFLSAPLQTEDEVKDIYTSPDYYYGDNFYAEVNSAGGVKVNWCANNIYDKTIKYIHITMRLYNAVGDKIVDDFGNSQFTETIIGPIEPGEGFRHYSDTPFTYTYNCSKLSIEEVDIEYMDGTTVSGYYNYSTNVIR